MSLLNLPMYQALRNRMDWAQERQSLISQNLANVDTPGYRAQDLQELSFRDVLNGSTRQVNASFRTNAAHIGLGSSSSEFDRFNQKTTKTLDGNAVSLEEEMLKMNETANRDYEMKMIMRKHLDLMKMALRTK